MTFVVIVYSVITVYKTLNDKKLLDSYRHWTLHGYYFSDIIKIKILVIIVPNAYKCSEKIQKFKNIHN